MNLHLEEVRLEVRAHRGTGDTDAQSREGVEARDVVRGLGDRLLRTFSSGEGGRRASREPPPDRLRLDAHANETRKPEHDGNADVLHLLRGVRVAGVCTEPLHPGVGDAVQEDDERLDEFGRGVDAVVARGAVPGPAKFGEGSQEPRERDETIAPEDAAL